MFHREIPGVKYLSEVSSSSSFVLTGVDGSSVTTVIEIQNIVEEKRW